MNISIFFNNLAYAGFALCDSAEKVDHVLSSVSGNITLKGFPSMEAAYCYACHQFFRTRVKQQQELNFYLPRMEDMTGAHYIYVTPSNTMPHFAQNHILAGMFEDKVIIAASSASATAFMEMYPLAYMQEVNSPEEAAYLLNAWSLRYVFPMRAYLSEQPLPIIKNIKLDTVWSTGVNEWYQRNLQFIPPKLQLQKVQVAQRVSSPINE